MNENESKLVQTMFRGHLFPILVDPTLGRLLGAGHHLRWTQRTSKDLKIFTNEKKKRLFESFWIFFTFFHWLFNFISMSFQFHWLSFTFIRSLWDFGTSTCIPPRFSAASSACSIWDSQRVAGQMDVAEAAVPAPLERKQFWSQI